MGGILQGLRRIRVREDNRSEPRVGTLSRDSASGRYTPKSD